MDHATLSLLLTRLGRLNEAFLTDHCRLHATTPAELQVLTVLRHHPAEAVPPTAIAAWIVQTSGGLTATLRRLEGAGLIHRTADPADGRGRLVSLTQAGAGFHDRVFDDLMDRYRLVFADIEPERALDAVRHLMRGFERLQGLGSSADWTYRAEATA